MKFIISPYTKPLRDGKINAKNYPYWERLINLLKPSHDLCQIGITNEKPLVDNFIINLKMAELVDLAKGYDAFIAIDNFFPHFMNCHFPDKRGIVLFGPSDPVIFGYKQNINLFAAKQYFRKFQFDAWEAQEANDLAHADPYLVITALRKLNLYTAQLL